MGTQEEFIQVLQNTKLIALASSFDDAPNVRILDFYFNPQTKTLVFPTSSKSSKVNEFEQNNKVAFTTIPAGPGPVIRVKNATVQKSSVSIDDIKDTLIQKREGFDKLLMGLGDSVVMYEVSFNEAVMSSKGEIIHISL